VYVNLHCIVRNLKLISNMSFLPPEKISADAHWEAQVHVIKT